MASQKLSFAKQLTLGLTLAQALPLGATDAAHAQFFFQPFGYSYRYDVPPPPPYDEERPRFATPRAVSRILARRGFELASSLGRRGDQVVVTGVSRRDGTFRFFIDPYEGEVIHAVRLARPSADAPAIDGPSAGAPRDLGPPTPDKPGPRRSARPAGEPTSPGARPPQPVEPVAKAPPAPPPVTAPAPATPPTTSPEAAKPQESPKPLEWAKPAEIAKPPEPAKVEPPKPEAPRAETLKPEAPKAETSTPAPAKPDPGKSQPAKPDAAKPADVKAEDAKAASARPGVPGRRAIVAPKAPDAAATAPR